MLIKKTADFKNFFFRAVKPRCKAHFPRYKKIRRLYSILTLPSDSGIISDKAKLAIIMKIIG